jgi:hypothetical protein
MMARVSFRLMRFPTPYAPVQVVPAEVERGRASLRLHRGLAELTEMESVAAWYIIHRAIRIKRPRFVLRPISGVEMSAAHAGLIPTDAGPSPPRLAAKH